MNVRITTPVDILDRYNRLDPDDRRAIADRLVGYVSGLGGSARAYLEACIARAEASS